MQWNKLSFVFILFSSSTFAIQDSFLLAEIVVNTARELEELEKLITQTKKHTEKLSEFADTVDDYTYRAERLKSWAQDLKDLSSENANELSDINSLLRQIRMIEEDTQRLYVEYSKREYKNENEISKYDRISKNQKINSKKYQRQALRSQKNTSRSMQQVAQNTATMAYEQSKTNQMMAEQNKKLAQVYKVVLETEKREFEKQSRIKKKYEGLSK